jgi:hypothetical protein
VRSLGFIRGKRHESPAMLDRDMARQSQHGVPVEARKRDRMNSELQESLRYANATASLDQPSPQIVILGMLRLVTARREDGFFFEHDRTVHNGALPAKPQGRERLRSGKAGAAHRVASFAEKLDVGMGKDGA